MKKPNRRKPGQAWRILAWDEKRSAKYEMEDKGTFDELVIDDWFHLEQMDFRDWWARIGDAWLWIHVPPKGPPVVTVRRGEYGPTTEEMP